MKAMIFAAGLGTRLRPLTDHCPKALIEVGGEPMLGRVLRRAIDAGVTEAVVNVHHLPQMIVDYLAANSNFGITIHVSHEDDLLLDTGGGLLAARRWLDGNEDILVHNADIFTDVDIRDMYRHHMNSGSDVTLMAWKRDSSRALLIDKKGRMHGWTNIATGEVCPPSLAPVRDTMDTVAFGGVHVVSPRIFSHLEHYASEHGQVFSIMPFYVSACSAMPVSIYTPPAPVEWADIGKLNTLENLRNKYPSHH